MAFSLTGLVTGGNRLLAARGAGQVEGEDKRMERERMAAEAQRQALRDSLLNDYQRSQINYMDAGAEQRRTPKPEKQLGYSFLTGPSGEVLVGDRGSGTVRPAGQSVGARPVPRGRVSGVRGGTSSTAQRPIPLAERQIRQSADLFGEMINRMQGLARRDPAAALVDWNSVAGEVLAGAGGSRAQGIRGKASQGLAIAGLTPNQRLYRQYLRTAVDHYLGALRLRATNQVMDDLRASLAPQLGQGPEAVQPLFEVQNALARRTHETAYGAGAPVVGSDDARASTGETDPGVAAADDFIRRRAAAAGRRP